MSIEAVLIDSREPQWVQKLTFGNLPTIVEMLPTGDLQAVTSTGEIIIVERKTPEDFLNSLRDERLFPQLARMVAARIDEQATGTMTTWPYLVITGELRRGQNGKIFTDDRGATGWDWVAIQGALLTIQEMGIFIVYCAGDSDYENCIQRLAARERTPLQLLPPRPPAILGPGAAFLASLPGIGTDRVTELMSWAGNSPAFALVGITDLEIDAPLGKAIRRKIRHVLGLKDHQVLSNWVNTQDEEVLRVIEHAESV